MMSLSKRQIAESFSNGNFKAIYSYLSETIKWNVFDNFLCDGKEEVIAQCEKTANYFNSITTDFKQTDVIESDDKVVITGTAKLSNEGRLIEFITACDIYEFDSQSLLQQITSYCLVKKKE